MIIRFSRTYEVVVSLSKAARAEIRVQANSEEEAEKLALLELNLPSYFHYSVSKIAMVH